MLQVHFGHIQLKETIRGLPRLFPFSNLSIHLPTFFFTQNTDWKFVRTSESLHNFLIDKILIFAYLKALKSIFSSINTQIEG